MDIEQALKSNDIEIITLYADLALEKYNVNEINNMINKKYYIGVNDGYFYFCKNSRTGSIRDNKIAKLNFTFRK